MYVWITQNTECTTRRNIGIVTCDLGDSEGKQCGLVKLNIRR